MAASLRIEATARPVRSEPLAKKGTLNPSLHVFRCRLVLAVIDVLTLALAPWRTLSLCEPAPDGVYRLWGIESQALEARAAPEWALHRTER